MKSSYLCLVGVVAGTMAFPGCAMDDNFKGVYDAMYSAVEKLRNEAVGRQDAINAAKEAFLKDKGSFDGEVEGWQNLDPDQVIAAIVAPNDTLHNCGLQERTVNKITKKINIANSSEVYGGIASKFFLPLFENMNGKLDGASGVTFDNVPNIPYDGLIAAASDENKSAIIGKYLMIYGNGLISDADYVKKFIGLFGVRVGAALMQNKLKLADVTNGVEVLKSLLIMSGHPMQQQPGKADIDAYGTYKTLLEIAPDFLKSLEANGGLKGFIKETQQPASQGGQGRNPNNASLGDDDNQSQMQQQQQVKTEQKESKFDKKMWATGGKSAKQTQKPVVTVEPTPAAKGGNENGASKSVTALGNNNNQNQPGANAPGSNPADLGTSGKPTVVVKVDNENGSTQLGTAQKPAKKFDKKKWASGGKK